MIALGIIIGSTLSTFVALAWTVPTATLTGNASSYHVGDPAITLSWSSTDSTSCTGTNFSTGNAVSGAVPISPVASTTYSVACFGPGGSASSNFTVTVVPPYCTVDNTGAPVTGYAWSETIGWIDMSCRNFGTCGSHPFGLYVAPDGTVSGCAWSENVGWVSASQGDSISCPSGTCKSSMTPTTWTGWLRALAPISDPQAGSWDGWISLNGTASDAGHSPFGIAINSGTMSGFAWGDMNVGWVDFSQVHTAFACTPTYTCNGNIIQNSCDSSQNVTCTAPRFCSPGSSVCLYPQPQAQSWSGHTGHLEVAPKLLAKGATAKVYWSMTQVQSCTVTGTNGQTWNGAFSGASGTSTAPINQATNFTLDCLELDNSHYTELVAVTMLPVFQER